jgi:F420-non-reducing hydrogenase iron-sulfur subunit
MNTMPADEVVDPRILVFTTISISDPGIDLAGSAHMHYPPSVMPLMVPCSSGIRPSWILHALKSGFDGVFIAADGTDCAFVPDCTNRTGEVVSKAQKLIEEHGYNARRLKMAAICSVCSESFVSHMEKFRALLKEVKDS